MMGVTVVESNWDRIFKAEFQKLNSFNRLRVPSSSSLQILKKKRSYSDFSETMNIKNKTEVQTIHFQTKNRYKSVLAYPEETRVKLNPKIHANIHSSVIDLDNNDEIFENDDSDYINANYVNGEVDGSYRNYIACQAPLESTMEDFWRMIWEQRSGIIVMLTPLIEMVKNANDSELYIKVQANSYWPEEGKVKRYGNLLVCHKNTFILGEITVRSILIRESPLIPPQNANSGNSGNSGNSSNSSSIPTREIIQLHYEGWPDNGIPTFNKTLRDLLLLLSKFKKRASGQYGLNGPAVVHCSAGLGRTGTFIAAHITLERMLYNLPPRIKNTVELIRQQRVGMVRNEDQYALIYSVIKDLMLTPGLFKDSFSSTSSSLSPSTSTSSSSPSTSTSISTSSFIAPTIIQKKEIVSNSNNNNSKSISELVS